ncbi:YodC family protein [Erwinia mallotivora]|uniref:YodC family protein n=1 Tax=Erwinia mallotivora TaxID=69222 RepID=UPI0035E58139
MIVVSEEVQLREGGPAMIVTGTASGMVECRWYDGYSVRREAFREDELYPLNSQTELVSRSA